MAVSLTENAARHIRNSIAELGGVALRLGVKKVGCSGLAYTFDVAKEIAPGDHLYEAHDAKLVIDPTSLPYLDGSTLDFKREGLAERLFVNNPNAKSMCGCGESFSVDQ